MFLRPFSKHCTRKGTRLSGPRFHIRGREGGTARGGRKIQLTLSSMICHFSPTRSASSDHISFLTAMYAVASVSSFTPSHCSALRRSISRSCRLRHAFAVLLGKCFDAMGCQFKPEALADVRISSSSTVHMEVTRDPLASDGRVAGTVL